MSNMSTIEITPTVRVRIEQDFDPESPAEWDNLGEIAYRPRREVLGTENVSDKRMSEIAKGVRDGDLIGMPVWAYVHSGSTIRAAYTNPFGCPWDSGQSGFVYTTREKALKEFGGKRLTKQVREKTLKVLEGEVKTFDMYLQGDVWGVIVERLEGDEWVEVESCWGVYGWEYAKSEALHMFDQCVEPEVV